LSELYEHNEHNSPDSVLPTATCSAAVTNGCWRCWKRCELSEGYSPNHRQKNTDVGAETHSLHI